MQTTPGETDLKTLLRSMSPELHSGEYVFCTFADETLLPALEALGTFREREGWTVILPKAEAVKHALAYSFVAAWITLNVHSALEAVGLTAAVSQALADEGISCNMVAAFYHDHIFIAQHDADRAMRILQQLSANS